MIYVSSKNSDIPCVISTKLKVARYDVDPSLGNMGYWPSYGRITTDARKAYLTWLAGGRKDPDADIGYVFLFYGLEYRFFKEVKKNSKLKNESVQIEDEVKRLLSIYSHSGSFNAYALNFLNFVQLWRDGTDAEAFKSQTTSRGILSEINIGKLIFDKKPLPADVVYDLIRSNCYLNTPGKRCKNEMQAIFSSLYRKKHGEGLRITPRTRNKTVVYHPASIGIIENTSLTLKGISDFSIGNLPTKSLETMIRKAETLLDPYSRFIGKDKKVTMEAKLYLPQEIRSSEFANGIEKIKERIGTGPTTMSLCDLLSVFDINSNIGIKSTALFVEMLSDESIAFIPAKPIDRKIDVNMRVALLLSQSKIKVNDNIAYPKTVIYAISYIFSGITAASDADINNIVSSLVKSDGDKIYLKTIFGQDVTPTELKAYIQKIDKNKKEVFLRDVVIRVANITGITPDAVKKIEKIGAMLSLDTKDLHSIIHGAHVKTEIKVGNKLDFDKIKELKKSSKEISEILDEVFIDENTTLHQSEAKKSTKNPTCALNLTGKKEEFFNMLISKNAWDKNDLNRVAKSKGLMLDGMLEEINERAFEIFDSNFIDLDDKIYVNLELLEA
jgi:hypothetical protein